MSSVRNSSQGKGVVLVSRLVATCFLSLFLATDANACIIGRVLSAPVRLVQRARPVRRAFGCSQPARLRLNAPQAPAAPVAAPACANGLCPIPK